MTLMHYALGLAAGTLAGTVNSIAGGGAFVLLPTLTFFGLSVPQANGTLRVAILMQNTSAVIAFVARGIGDFGGTVRLALPITVGALGGAAAAVRVPPTWLGPIVGAVFLLWGAVIALRPGRFVGAQATSDNPRIRRRCYVWALLIGVYGGFLQAGVGLPLLGLLVSGIGYEPVLANAVKVQLVMAYTVAILPIFVGASHVALRPGVTVGLGMVVGSQLGVLLQVRRGPALVRWVLFASVLASGVILLLRR